MSGASDGDDAYDLGSSFPIAEARRQRPGTTLLITGTSDLTERAAFDILLAEPEAREGVVPVSTDRSGADLESEFAGRSGGSLDDRLAVIDVTGTSESGTRPDDLAAIGRELNEAIDRVDRPRVRIGVLSLTGMLGHLDRAEVFKFCHVVRDRIADAGYLGIATLDTDEVPEATVSMLQDAFDATVEVDEDEKGGIVRVIGLSDAPVTWHAWS